MESRKYYLSDKTIDFILFALEESLFLAQKEYDNKTPSWTTFSNIRDNMKAIEKTILDCKMPAQS